jgi:NTE family protein
MEKLPKNIFLIVLTSLCIFLEGCQTPVCRGKETIPDHTLTINTYPTPVRVAVVLGGGGARGMAHVGVLEELENANIPIDLIVGCSAGSIVGALYANNPDIQYVKNTLMKKKRKDFFVTNFFRSRFGFFHRKPFICFTNQQLGCKNFEDLTIHLAVVATDLLTGELVTFNSGPVSPPVHASCAVPVCFTPINYGGRFLVDGGVADPVPVQVAQDFGAEIIIAVDIGPQLNNIPPENLFQVGVRSAFIKHISQSNISVKGADFVINPGVGHIGMFDEDCNEELYLSGKNATKEIIPELKEYLSEINFSTDCE